MLFIILLSNGRMAGVEGSVGAAEVVTSWKPTLFPLENKG